MSRLHPIRWLRGHPDAGDWLLALLVTTAAVTSHVFGSAEIEQAASPSVWRIALVVAATLPIAWRRRSPIAILAVVFAAQLACDVTDTFGTGWIGVVVAMYTMAAHCTGRRRNRAAIVVGALMTLIAIGASIDAPEEVTDVLGMGVVLIAAFTIGDNMRRRRDRIEHLAERAERAEREQELLARQRVSEERTRIARELHDVVAHSVSVMVIQAGAARRQLATNPERARGALEVIELTGREAMDEMRRILGVLRDDGVDHGGPELVPQPSLASIAELVAGDSTLPSRYMVDGDLPGSIPPSVELSAYRIVQEALTNVRKHAGTVRCVEVAIAHADGALRIEISDDGWGASSASADDGGSHIGHGITGMQERVALCGGTLAVGPRSGGGWRVRARLPTGPSNGSEAAR
ncbi:MAG TPA: sensor histidine kinase [Ilumatobacteraceae bacterium]